MTINEVAKARSASWTGNYSLIWSGLSYEPVCVCGGGGTVVKLY